MKVSFISTFLNEENNLESFLSSLNKQTLLPDEIILVDGGSTDSSSAKIHDTLFMLHDSKLKPTIIQKKGNRSTGRNEAIKHATCDIIAVSDVGCILDRDWLKNIVEPFKDESVDVVSGFYKAKTGSTFEKCLAAYTSTMPDKVDSENFLPSSRSVAFRKKVWEKVSGYPEDLDTCEDLIFDKKLKQAGFKFVFQKKAIVHWPQRKNIWQAFKQFFSYAVGDGQALYIRSQTPFLFARYILGLVLLMIFPQTNLFIILYSLFFILFLYLIWSILKNYKYVNHAAALIYLPSLQIASDIAVILGMTAGLIKRI